MIDFKNCIITILVVMNYPPATLPTRFFKHITSHKQFEEDVTSYNIVIVHYDIIKSFINTSIEHASLF